MPTCIQCNLNLADGVSVCPRCRRRFLAHLNVGFGADRRITIDAQTGMVNSVGAPPWYADRFSQAMASQGRPAPGLEIVQRRKRRDDVVLINALDSTYGHVLQALYGCQSVHNRHPEASTILIVPAFAAWLAPDYIDELWIVAAPLRECNLWNSAVAQATAELLAASRRVRLTSVTWHIPDEIDIETFSHVKPLHGGSIEAIIPPRLTLVWRDDRCWTNRGRDLDPPLAIAEQFELYRRLLERIRQEMPDLVAAVIGYGSFGRFPEWVSDLRTVEQDSAREKAWVERCADTHLVFGMHGSNMILPAAHAIGAVEVTPNILYPYFTWEWANQHSAQTALQRYRLLPQSTSVSDVVSIVFIMLRRMQQGLIYQMPTQLRFELLARDPRVFQSGYDLTLTDAAGAPL